MASLTRRGFLKGVLATIALAAIPAPLVKAAGRLAPVAKALPVAVEPATAVILAPGAYTGAEITAAVAGPIFTGSFADLLDKRVTRIFYESYYGMNQGLYVTSTYMTNAPKKRRRHRGKVK